MRAWLLILLAAGGLAGCGGDDSSDGDPPQPPVATPLPLPPAGTSRWAAVELDHDGDGLAEVIWRYEYDSAGRRTAEFEWNAQRGISIGEPVFVRRWTYDSLSRLVSASVDGGYRSGYLIEGTYGSSGLLASTRSKYKDSGDWEEIRYTWQGQRMVEYAEVGLKGTLWKYILSYDSGGRINRIEWPQADYEQYFRWRADGQLIGAGSSGGGEGMGISLEYDNAGRLVSSMQYDMGDGPVSNYFYDRRGRVERISAETSSYPVRPLDYRIRWEDGLCQPVYRLGAPPEWDWLTNQAHADGTTFGCAH